MSLAGSREYASRAEYAASGFGLRRHPGAVADHALAIVDALFRVVMWNEAFAMLAETGAWIYPGQRLSELLPALTAELVGMIEDPCTDPQSAAMIFTHDREKWLVTISRLDGGSHLFAISMDRQGTHTAPAEAERLRPESGKQRQGETGAANGPAVLSPSEDRVLELILEGKTSKEIAAGLGLSVETIRTHRKNICVKLDAHSTAELILFALRRGSVRSSGGTRETGRKALSGSA